MILPDKTVVSLPYSEERAKLIDEEVSSLIETQFKRALQILKKHKGKVQQLADALLNKEVIFKNDLEDIFGIRKWKSYSEEQLEETDQKKIKRKK